jgi:hypothetical protein
MSNVNDWNYAKYLDQFKAKVLDPQIKRTEDASKIMNDPKYPWKDEEQKANGEKQYANYKQWVQFYQAFYDAGMELVKQHESLVNNMAKHYDKWYKDVSNEGRQETELMSEQADILNGIFEEIWRELKPLGLPLEPPAGLNLK